MVKLDGVGFVFGNMRWWTISAHPPAGVDPCQPGLGPPARRRRTPSGASNVRRHSLGASAWIGLVGRGLGGRTQRDRCLGVVAPALGRNRQERRQETGRRDVGGGLLRDSEGVAAVWEYPVQF